MPLRNGLILRQRVPDQPPGTDPQEVLHGIRRIICPLQLLFQRRKRVFLKASVNALMPLQSLVANGSHVRFFISEVLNRVPPEILDALLARPLTVLLLRPEVEELVDDLEQPLVLMVDTLHADFELVLPYKFSHHSTSSFAAAAHLRGNIDDPALRAHNIEGRGTATPALYNMWYLLSIPLLIFYLWEHRHLSTPLRPGDADAGGL